jgi:succinate dehydrogenase/fumarate reductase flavoprotein subunit
VSGAAAALQLDADVLVIGGGPAATWAALTARSEGARVVFVDKGMCGSSGVAPAATVGHWWVEPARREEAIIERDEVGGNLSQRSWTLALLEETWRRWPEVGLTHGYPAGGILRRLTSPGAQLCQGPIYLREMRRRVSHSGVRILDHSPTLELLIDADGEVAGAAGVQRQTHGRRWRVRAGAVVLAAGGCAWRSGSLGSNVNTGDGYLMAAEVGVSLSGMEFSNYYGIVPKGSSMDKNGFNMVSTFYDGDIVQSGWSEAAGASGAGGGLPGGPADAAPVIPGRPVGTGEKAALIRASLRGPVFQRMDLAPPQAWEGMRAQMPNFFITLDRLGIDPFRDRYEVEFVNEGTVRGTGGVRIVDDTCWTGVPGLWVAGDAASREAIVGGSSGAGAPNAAWTISSGTWSGRAAAAHALGRRARIAGATAADAGTRPQTASPGAFNGLTGAGRAGLRPTGIPLPEGAWREVTVAIQDEINPPAKNGLRSQAKLDASLRELESIWRAIRAGLGAPRRSTSTAGEQVSTRETAAMAASARWAYLSAAARTESRAMHVREDFTEPDPSQRHRVLVTGVDMPQVTFQEIEYPVTPTFDYARVAAA